MRLSSLGDIVNLTVIFSKLRKRFPEAEIEFLVKKQFKDIVSPNNYGIKITVYDSANGLKGWLKICKEKQQENFDIFLDMHNNIRSKLLSFYVRKARKFQYKKPLMKRFLLFNFHINLFSKSYNLVDEYLKVLKPLGIENNQPKTEIKLSEEVLVDAQNILKQKGVKKKYAVILPISVWETKRYPLEKFPKIADYLTGEKDMDVVWLGGKADTYLNQFDINAEHNFKIVGETSLMESIAILAKSEIVIANDTGLPYAAQAVGTPALIIFGPSSRETSAGYVQNGSMVLEKKIWCRPCSKGDRKCFRKERYCMQYSMNEINQYINKIISGESQ